MPAVHLSFHGYWLEKRTSLMAEIGECPPYPTPDFGE